MNIRLSPKHGVNPSLMLCFFCGGAKGVALVGRMKDDTEAPKKMITNYVPCDKCQEIMNHGILLVEADAIPTSPNQLEIKTGAYPTGEWWVLKEGVLDNIIKNKDLMDTINKKRMTLISHEGAIEMGLFDEQNQPT